MTENEQDDVKTAFKFIVAGVIIALVGGILFQVMLPTYTLDMDITVYIQEVNRLYIMFSLFLALGGVTNLYGWYLLVKKYFATR